MIEHEPIAVTENIWGCTLLELPDLGAGTRGELKLKFTKEARGNTQAEFRKDVVVKLREILREVVDWVYSFPMKDAVEEAIAKHDRRREQLEELSRALEVLGKHLKNSLQ